MYATYTSRGLPQVHVACLKALITKNHNVHATAFFIAFFISYLLFIILFIIYFIFMLCPQLASAKYIAHE